MAKLNLSEIKSFLDYKADLYENQNFIENDPISIPHLFKKRGYRNKCFYNLHNIMGQRTIILKTPKKL